jgi:hypothetical protein
MGKLKSTCANCETEFYYYPGRSTGKFCSNTCQGEHKIKSKLREGVVLTKAMRRYVNGLSENCCECGQNRTWNGKPLTLQVDHIDGNVLNNRIENLRLLCPNCHTQTETWGTNNISDENWHKLATNKG